MAVYKAFHPDNETLGIAILAMIKALDYRDISAVLVKDGFPADVEQIQPDAWYPMQQELDVMRDVAATGGMVDLVTIGMKIPDMVEYPVEITTITEALTMLNAGYQHNHRGTNVGSFSYAMENPDDTKLRMTAHTPYPSDLEYGIIYRLVQKFRPSTSQQITVKHINTPDNRKNGGDSCQYDVQW